VSLLQRLTTSVAAHEKRFPKKNLPGRQGTHHGRKGDTEKGLAVTTAARQGKCTGRINSMDLGGNLFPGIRVAKRKKQERGKTRRSQPP